MISRGALGCCPTRFPVAAVGLIGPFGIEQPAKQDLALQLGEAPRRGECGEMAVPGEHEALTARAGLAGARAARHNHDRPLLALESGDRGPMGFVPQTLPEAADLYIHNIFGKTAVSRYLCKFL